jgi:hypothetical protein
LGIILEALLTTKVKKSISNSDSSINGERFFNQTGSAECRQQLRLVNVKRKHKTQLLLVIGISLLLPLLSACIDYFVLMEADFLSTYPTLENVDLDCFLFCKKDKFTVLSGFSHACRVASRLIEHLPGFHCQVTFPHVNTLVLRC